MLCEKSNKLFCSDEFCNFYDGAGSVLDSQHYIHPWKLMDIFSNYHQEIFSLFCEIAMHVEKSRKFRTFETDGHISSI